ncbi:MULTISPECIES: phosphoenolpyruvate--protein phosphotransferase [unclassified Desulfovibrio]|uniref:phosphoenolpyruvate--protein phosphotransferase n=1 Tax=unclassified Desulfovibrio TaxID=2593640 RepID=UPI0013EB6150|nr:MULTISPECIES: phosphoenolpyruvate--protein phosphotransferase [unclassified Desulfovibrio]
MARAVIYGIPVSPGLALGAIRRLHGAPRGEHRRIADEAVPAEEEALRAAAARVRAELEATLADMPPSLADYAEIVGAQMELASDPRLVGTALARIRHRKICAAWALEETVEELCELFRGMDDPYLRDRAQDVRAMGLRLGEALQGEASGAGGFREDAGILVAEDLAPADVMELEGGTVLAILTAEGGPTSHTAILARSLRVPALVGVTGLPEAARDGETAIVDGLSGRVLLTPDEADLARYAERKAAYGQWEAHARQAAQRPAESRDGVALSVRANLENAAELGDIDECGADGVGLYRTEFSYLGRELPGEDELFGEYAAVAARLAPRPVIFRTLDVGADKALAAHAALREPNPALGLRGIRFCLAHEDMFRTQLRALLRAGVAGNVALMLPMITDAREVRSVRRILHELRQELAAGGVAHAAHLPLGVMIETPAAILTADTLARECDFFSIGTNDLIHYLMAIDRNNRHVAYLHEPLHPAVVRSLKRVVDAAHREGIPVSVCGEFAADPYGVALLLGMGVDALSAAPRFVPGIKHMLRKLSADGCAELVHTVLNLPDAAAGRQLIHERLHRVLGQELAFLSTNHAKPGLP